MSDWSEEGAVPVDDAAVPDPPTVDEVLEEQRQRDDLPDPSDDPDHQQVVDDDEASKDEATSHEPTSDAGTDALAGQAIADNMPPEARPDLG